MKEAKTCEATKYIVNESTVVIIEGPFEADDHGIEHHTVSPITFRGESSPDENAIPLAEAPEDVRSRIADAYGVLTKSTFGKQAQDI